MFHESEVFVKESSPTAAENPARNSPALQILIIISISTCIALFIWLVRSFNSDPYIQTTLNLEGSIEKGDRLFRMNCAGCHGITAQGLVGPNLREVIYQRKDSDIINQVVKGRTPPMPSFQMEPQAMADLLAYLHTIN